MMTSHFDTSGHSLFELLITIALAALILGLGLPALGGLAADKRLRAEADALFHAVHLARKLSVTRRRVITLCGSLDGASCDADGDWSAGWILFENSRAPGHGVRTADEPILERRQITSDVRIESNRAAFSMRDIFVRATNGTVRICDPYRRAASRAVVISYTGRPRVSRKDSRGRAVNCAH